MHLIPSIHIHQALKKGAGYTQTDREHPALFIFTSGSAPTGKIPLVFVFHYVIIKIPEDKPNP
jgi:hypothetical protein